MDVNVNTGYLVFKPDKPEKHIHIASEDYPVKTYLYSFNTATWYIRIHWLGERRWESIKKRSVPEELKFIVSLHV